MRVKKLPHILALHLKRFKYMEQLNRYTKLSYRVVFPLELRLFNTVSAPYLYTVMAIIEGPIIVLICISGLFD